MPNISVATLCDYLNVDNEYSVRIYANGKYHIVRSIIRSNYTDSIILTARTDIEYTTPSTAVSIRKELELADHTSKVELQVDDVRVSLKSMTTTMDGTLILTGDKIMIHNHDTIKAFNDYIRLDGGLYKLTESVTVKLVVNLHDVLMPNFNIIQGTIHIKKGFVWNGSNVVPDVQKCILASCVHDALVSAEEAGLYKPENRYLMDEQYIRLLEVYHLLPFRVAARKYGLALARGYRAFKRLWS